MLGGHNKKRIRTNVDLKNEVFYSMHIWQFFKTLDAAILVIYSPSVPHAFPFNLSPKGSRLKRIKLDVIKSTLFSKT